MIDAETLGRLLPEYLPRQRWFPADKQLDHAEVVAFDELRSGFPALAWSLVDATFADGEVARYQVFVGLRSIETYESFLDGKGRALLGDVDTEEGPALAYDAFVDPELALAVFGEVAPDEVARLVRPLTVEQSNTSIVYDERLILKVFRRVHPGANPDAEVTRALADVGFSHISAPVAEWRRDGTDLAVLRTYLVGGTDGFHLAQTSLRDLYDRRLPPEQCGGDFGPEAHRLGQVTGELHLALAAAFGSDVPDVAGWRDDMVDHLARVVPAARGGSADVARLDAERIGERYDRLAEVGDAGAAIRIHGDYHLGQTMRTDDGWYLLDFEGEPTRPIEERRRPSSPLRDVAGMLRSFHYAARVTLAERGEGAEDELADLGRQWERRVGDAFWDGYRVTEGVGALLPPEPADIDTVLVTFLLDKAVYECGYELAHRPDWVDIPLEAVDRLLEAS
ncbi:phosphotransferase [soil metagenome]